MVLVKKPSKMDANPDQAINQKTIAEAKFKNSNIKSALKHAKKAHRLNPSLEGLSSMLTAFKILRVASESPSDTTKDWYKILQVEPFSHINTIKKQYKKLALALHPDKNPYLWCEDAFKLVGEGFRVLSDKIRRKEYDMILRIRLQDENLSVKVETFWTACSRCRLLHQFERRYLGYSLVCPSCKKSFKAVEVEDGEGDKNENDGGRGGGSGVRARPRSERVRRKVFNFENLGLGGKKVGVSLSGEHDERIVDLRSRLKGGAKGKVGSSKKSESLRKNVGGGTVVDEGVRSVNLKGDEGGAGEWGGGRLRSGGLRRKTSTFDEVLEKSEPKRVKFGGEEMMTLAEMQLEVKKKVNKEREKLKEKQKDLEEKEKMIEEEEEKRESVEKSNGFAVENGGTLKKSKQIEKKTSGVISKSRNLERERHSALKSESLKIRRNRAPRRDALVIMEVEDSDFYDFDRDRTERSFKKGQVWAMYADNDGMPRTYGLICDVVSLNPFQVNLSCLDIQSNGNEESIGWERMGFHISCGRFKVTHNTIIESLNIFSHVVDCERAAREVYRIYPTKGSVWALYDEADLDAEGRILSDRDKQCYDIIVVLSTYTEIHGLSIAYLEKVDGFKTVFKRREIGCHAIRCLEKDCVRLFSHQIPARKLSGDEVPDLKDCWELDPASLPSDVLTIAQAK